MFPGGMWRGQTHSYSPFLCRVGERGCDSSPACSTVLPAPLPCLLARERLSALSSFSLLSTVLSCLFTAWGRAGAGCCWGSRSERSTGRSRACQQPSNQSSWQQDGGAVRRKISEGAVICLQKWDFKRGSKHRCTGRPGACSLPFKHDCPLFLGKLFF